MISGRYGKPALIGGIAMGIPSALPYVDVGLYCCCLYVWVGSILAAYLLFKSCSGSTLGDGALVGLLSGIFGSLVWVLIATPFAFAMRQSFDPRSMISPEQLEALPQQWLDLFDFVSNMSPMQLLAIMAARFVVTLALFALIGTLGGLIGAAIFRKKEEQPAQWTDEQPAQWTDQQPPQV